MEKQSEQKTTSKLTVVITVAVVLLVIGLIVVVVLGYWLNWQWVGVSGGNSKITTTTTTTEQPPAKTLWDWLGLLGVLAIPVVVGFGVAWFTRTQQLRDQTLADDRARSEKVAAEQRAKLEHELTLDNQRETALQTYLDKMSEIFQWRFVKNGELVFQPVAQARTISVLQQLDPSRKVVILQFLNHARLISVEGHGPIVSLADADLRKVDLSTMNFSKVALNKAKLNEVNLEGADLEGAILKGAILDNASLRGADLTGAILSTALNLSKADLSGARYNKNEISKKDDQGNAVNDEQGKPVMIKPTQWPQGFDYKSAGCQVSNT